MARTRAIAVAEQEGVQFRLFEYEHDPGAPSYGAEAAEKLGVDPARVFKTLVVEIDGKPAVAIVPVQAELDLRGLRKQLPTLLDESAVAFETVYVSAGRRGLELQIAPRDLLRLTGGEARRIARAVEPPPCGRLGTKSAQTGTNGD